MEHGTEWMDLSKWVDFDQLDKAPQATHVKNVRSMDVPLPDTVKEIIFDDDFNQPVRKWPPHLEGVYFGFCFNQPIDTLPDTVKEIFVGYYFDQKVKHWPTSLQMFGFGAFARSIVTAGRLYYFNLPERVQHFVHHVITGEMMATRNRETGGINPCYHIDPRCKREDGCVHIQQICEQILNENSEK